MIRTRGATQLKLGSTPSDGIAPAAKAKGWQHGWQTWLALNTTELTWTGLLIGPLLFVSLFIAR